jgi:hypothetical protein
VLNGILEQHECGSYCKVFKQITVDEMSEVCGTHGGDENREPEMKRPLGDGRMIVQVIYRRGT